MVIQLWIIHRILSGSNVIRMRSSYALKTNLVYNEITNPTPSDRWTFIDDAAGKFVDDYQYNFGSGDLDQYNGRFCKTQIFQMEDIVIL